MCQKLEILQHGEHGYIGFCAECEAFTLAFGTTLSAMFYDDLKYVGARIDSNLEAHRNRICPKQKAFLFRLGQDKTCQMVLTFQEMEQLDNMINEALIMHEANCILNSTHE